MLKVALLDMYNNESNRGIGMLQHILDSYQQHLDWTRFDVRYLNQLPDFSYDIYILSGGPGNPLENDGPWFDAFFQFLDQLWQFNQNDEHVKKHCFFICHSFQMACHAYQVGEISEREKYSFGTFAVHKTHEGKSEPFFQALADPFYIADFRKFQVTKPNHARLKAMGGHILCYETHPPHEHSERALMAIRFSETMFGTQFHPEADPAGLLSHFIQPERKKQVIDLYGEARYDHMMHDLNHPQKIKHTFETLIPAFLDDAIKSLSEQKVPVA